MTFDNITDMQVGSTKVESAWFNGQKVWPTTTSANWYGVKFTGSATTGERTGDLNSHKTLPLQSQMKGCTITGGGVIKWLNPTDWTKYEDGTAIDSALNVMVYVPNYYIKFIHNEEEDSDEVRISAQQFDDAVLLKGGYCSAYEAYNDNNVLKSKKGVEPSVNITRANFEAYAKANGDGWHAYTYAMHKAITWLFVVEYACRNSQATYNAVLTSEGYHQGGLGEGVTTSNEDGTYNFITCGTTDEFGNNTGVTDFAGVVRTYAVPRYRGIENPWGSLWKNTVDVIVNNETGSANTNRVYITDNPEHFAETTTDNFTLTDIQMISNQNYVSQLSNNTAGDLFPTNVTGASTTLYYCDYHLDNTSTTNRTVLIGGAAGFGGYCGWFCVGSSDGGGGAAAPIGCRVIYLAD